nr:FUSC family protein [uncultured Methanospirillum sp.]
MTSILLNLPRSYWIALVVVLVVYRNLETTMSRISMRALGTCIGVVIASALMLWSVPSGLFILIITVLASVRPYAKSRNYLVYTSVMTILIISLLEFNEPYIQGIIMDRLVNTLIGLFIASILEYAVWQLPLIQKSISQT